MSASRAVERMQWPDRWVYSLLAQSRWMRIPVGLVLAPLIATFMGIVVFVGWTIVLFDKPRSR